jgi:hypothetical protein
MDNAQPHVVMVNLVLYVELTLILEQMPILSQLHLPQITVVLPIYSMLELVLHMEL